MKSYLALFMLGLLFTKAVHAQQTAEAENVLRKTSETLNNLKTISYTSYREINNLKDNYFAKNEGDLYFEYDPEKGGRVSKFQLHTKDGLQVYNGTEYFFLNDQDGTIDYKRTTAEHLENLSLLYNSIVTLHIALPMIAEDHQIPKSMKDTLIEDKAYHLIKFDLHRKALNFPKGLRSVEADVTRLYQLIIDQETYLPYIILDGNNIDQDKYYTKTIFTNINTHPIEPKENSWFFSSYEGYRPKEETARIPLVAIGSSMPEWVLPEFKGQITDTLTSSDFNGKIVLMEFWIKNCGYCMQAFPDIKTLQEKHGQQLEILTINAHEQEDEIAFFYDREKPAYKMLYDGETLAKSLGIYAYPATIIVDQTGKVIYRASGFNKEKIEEIIKKNAS